jgi:hypothetical protein
MTKALHDPRLFLYVSLAILFAFIGIYLSGCDEPNKIPYKTVPHSEFSRGASSD